jgi:hypothetical protein
MKIYVGGKFRPDGASETQGGINLGRYLHSLFFYRQLGKE